MRPIFPSRPILSLLVIIAVCACVPVLLKIGGNHQQTVANKAQTVADSVKFRLLPLTDAEKYFDQRLVSTFHRLATKNIEAYELTDGRPSFRTTGTYIVGQDGPGMTYCLAKKTVNYNGRIDVLQDLTFLRPDDWEIVLKMATHLGLPRPSANCIMSPNFIAVRQGSRLEHYGNVLLFTGAPLYKELFGDDTSLTSLQRGDLLRVNGHLWVVTENIPQENAVSIKRPLALGGGLIVTREYRWFDKVKVDILSVGTSGWIGAARGLL